MAHPTTCPECGNNSLIAVYAHRLCDNCGWHTPGFENVEFRGWKFGNPLLDIFLDLPNAAQTVQEAQILDIVRAWRSRWMPGGAVKRTEEITPTREEAKSNQADSEPKPVAEPTPKIERQPQRNGPTTIRGRKPSKFKQQRWKIIQKVYLKTPSLEGKQFWEKVEAEGGTPDPDWRANGCPKKLSDAYDDPEWRETLNTEKSRATQTLRKTYLQ